MAATQEKGQDKKPSNEEVRGLSFLGNRNVNWGEKWAKFNLFSQELEPIINNLNDLLKKYDVVEIDNIISFQVVDFKITPFISYESFPPSSIDIPASK